MSYESIDTSGFYKKVVDEKRTNFKFGKRILNKDFDLTIATKDDFTYPKLGWTYYDNVTEACNAEGVDVSYWGPMLFQHAYNFDLEGVIPPERGV
jgi:hypothetical protein